MNSPAPGALHAVVEEGNTTWENKHHTYQQPVQSLCDVWNPGNTSDVAYYSATTSTLQSLIATAMASGTRLRAFGGGWSFSKAPATEGRMVNTKPLDMFFRFGATYVDPRYTGDRAGLRFVQCGGSISALNARLREEQAPRSLRTTGASNGQTLVGAMSTGTHGSAIDVGAIQDDVVGIHLLVGPGRAVWLERASHPVTVPGFAALLGAEFIRDDALFNAALVSFGSFGIIHGVLIETEELFDLVASRKRMPLDAALRHTLTTLDFSGLPLPERNERPYHFEVLVSPYEPAGQAFVTTMYKKGHEPHQRPPTGKYLPGDDVLEFIGVLSDRVPESIPLLARKLLKSNYKELSNVRGTLGEIFTNTTTRGRAAGSAIAIPTAHANEVLDLALEINRTSGPYGILISLRFVKGTQATLGFTRFQPSCVVDLDGAMSERTMRFYTLAWKALRDRGIPHTLHWGKILDLDATQVRAAYGPAVDAWRAARMKLLGQDGVRTFSNDFIEGLGLGP